MTISRYDCTWLTFATVSVQLTIFFQQNDSVNKTDELGPTFMRKGIVGDWKNYFDDKTSAEWDEWIKNELEGTDFKMVFE